MIVLVIVTNIRNSTVIAIINGKLHSEGQLVHYYFPPFLAVLSKMPAKVQANIQKILFSTIQT